MTAPPPRSDAEQVARGGRSQRSWPIPAPTPRPRTSARTRSPIR